MTQTVTEVTSFAMFTRFSLTPNNCYISLRAPFPWHVLACTEISKYTHQLFHVASTSFLTKKGEISEAFLLVWSSCVSARPSTILQKTFCGFTHSILFYGNGGQEERMHVTDGKLETVTLMTSMKSAWHLRLIFFERWGLDEALFLVGILYVPLKDSYACLGSHNL